MTHTYDWSKLDAGWRFEPKRAGISYAALVHTTERGTDRHFAIEELEQGIVPTGWYTNYWSMLWPFALDQLAKCRVVDNTPLFEAMDRMADECATVTELRPRDEYDWSRLEGSGWFVEGDTITNREFVYMFTRNDHRLRCDDGCFDAESALVAQQEAERLVAKCRRDWRDDVKQACEGLVPLLQWPGNRALLQWEDGVALSTVDMMVTRRYAVIADTHSCETLLTMSLIIERLKKLGWREEA